MPRKNVLTVIILTAVLSAGFFMFSKTAQAATHYASPTGGGTTCSDPSPCTVQTGIGTLSAGDMLYLKDGNYSGTSGVINVTTATNGTSGNPITISAVNDGAVTIDGSSGYAIRIDGDWIIVEGINTHGSSSTSDAVVRVKGNNNIVRRVIAWDTYESTTSNKSIFHVYEGSNNLLEDVAGWGRGRKVFGRYGDSNTTFRRCFLMHNGYLSETSFWKIGISLGYNSNTTIIENCIGTWDYQSGYAPQSQAIFGGDNGGDAGTVKFYGNIGYFLSLQSGPLSNVYATGTAYSSIDIKDSVMYTQQSIDTFDTEVGHNCNYCTSIGGTLNVSGSWANSLTNPTISALGGNILQYNSTSRSSSGAWIRNRYVNGTLTGDSLWPWPMEDRIAAALVQSGYNSDGIDGNGSTSVTATVFELGGGTVPWMASTWYASPTGGGTTCSSGSPCAPEYAIDTKAGAGDTVILKDGTYDCAANANMCINISTSGTSGNPKTIRAETDGQAKINGGTTAETLRIRGVDYITVEGIVFHGYDIDGDDFHDDGCNIGNGSSNIILRRVSCYGGIQPLEISGGSSYITIEDSAFAHKSSLDSNDPDARKVALIISSDHITLRRNLFHWESDSPDRNVIVSLAYGSQNVLAENNIAIHRSGTGDDISGYTMWANTGMTVRNIEFYGNIAVAHTTSTGNGVWIGANNKRLDNLTFKDIVAISMKGGIFWRAGYNSTFENLLMVNSISNDGFRGQNYYDSGSPPESGWEMFGTLKNSNFSNNYGDGLQYTLTSYLTSLTNTYNNYYNNGTGSFGGDASPGTGEYCNDGCGQAAINPAYNTTTYGNGAYLMIPSSLKGKGEDGADIGAEVLYRYQNGIKTSTPLWPWPMEARICAETGYSVTYETGYSGCTSGGGLWKTLNGVYGNLTNPTDVNSDNQTNIKDIQACIKVITGSDLTYQAQCRVLAPPDLMTNIKDIQVIIREIIN